MLGSGATARLDSSVWFLKTLLSSSCIWLRVGSGSQSDVVHICQDPRFHRRTTTTSCCIEEVLKLANESIDWIDLKESLMLVDFNIDFQFISRRTRRQHTSAFKCNTNTATRCWLQQTSIKKLKKSLNYTDTTGFRETNVAKAKCLNQSFKTLISGWCQEGSSFLFYTAHTCQKSRPLLVIRKKAALSRLVWFFLYTVCMVLSTFLHESFQV